MRQRTTGICYKLARCRGQNFFLFHPAGPGYFREVPMNRFSIAVSGAQLSGKVTLKHAHSSGFAHPTATFDPSIHISIERPTHCCQKRQIPPRGTPEFAHARKVSPKSAYLGCCSHIIGPPRGYLAFFGCAVILTWCRCA